MLRSLTALSLALFPVAAWSSPMPTDELCRTLSIRAELFVLDESGTKFVSAQPGDRRVYRRPRNASSSDRRKTTANSDDACQISSSNWGNSSKTFRGPFLLRHEWFVKKSGEIRVVLEQYRKEEGEGGAAKFADLVKREERIVKDAAPVIWVSQTHTKERVVARLSLDFLSEPEPADISALPFSGSDMLIINNDGQVLANHVSATGKYVGIGTFQGTMYLSFSPFAGAKKIGVAQEGTVDLSLSDRKSVTINSKTAFLPEGVAANVYGLFSPAKKTDSLNSVHVRSTDSEKSILATINEDN